MSVFKRKSKYGETKEYHYKGTSINSFLKGIPFIHV